MQPYTIREIGNYTLGDVLGRGGTSEVYAAIDGATGDEVAIKTLRSPDPKALGREVARTKLIAHPNVVRIFDFGIEGDIAYLVMERLHGDDLATRLRAGALSEPEARAIGAAIADGAAAAHACGIVHRDLKPANVVLDAGGPKLVDFGIATSLGANATGPRMGTPAYMAPEQLVSNAATPSVDIFALGVVLYEMVTARPPFDCSNGAAPQLSADAPRLTSVTAPYAALVARCLARDPAHRPSTMTEVARLLRAASDERYTEPIGPSPSPSPSSPSPRSATPARRRAWIAIAIGTIVVLGGIAIASRGSAPSPSLAPTPTPSPSLSPSPSLPPSPTPTPPPVDLEVVDDIVDLEIRSRPSAAVIVDGKRLGQTPITRSLHVGAKVTLRRTGYRDLAFTVEKAGLVERALVALPLWPSTAKPPAGERLD